MPRAKRGNKRLEKRKKLLKLAKGYRGTRSKLYRSAKESVERGLVFAYTGRKLKKRDFRSLWIVRIGAACRLNGMNYSNFMHGLKVAGIERCKRDQLCDGEQATGYEREWACEARERGLRHVCPIIGRERMRNGCHIWYSFDDL